MKVLAIAAGFAAALATAAAALAQTGIPQKPLIPPAASPPASQATPPPTLATAPGSVRPTVRKAMHLHHPHWRHRGWRVGHYGRSERVAEQLNLQELQRLGAPPPR